MESVASGRIGREIVYKPALLPPSNDASYLERGILDSLRRLGPVPPREKERRT